MWRYLYPGFLGGRVGLGLLLLRVVMGAAFIFHGWPKIQNATTWMGPEAPFPGILQALAAAAEFGGGIALILGAFTPLAALLLAGTMFVAAFLVHMAAGDPFVATGPGQRSYELALVYLAASLLFLLAGPGHLSVDAQLFGRRYAGGSSPYR
jgi:putative oxidoreductase